jgi:hypothetical protein
MSLNETPQTQLYNIHHVVQKCHKLNNQITPMTIIFLTEQQFMIKVSDSESHI